MHTHTRKLPFELLQSTHTPTQYSIGNSCVSSPVVNYSCWENHPSHECYTTAAMTNLIVCVCVWWTGKTLQEQITHGSLNVTRRDMHRASLNATPKEKGSDEERKKKKNDSFFQTVNAAISLHLPLVAALPLFCASPSLSSLGTVQFPLGQSVLTVLTYFIPVAPNTQEAHAHKSWHVPTHTHI